MAASKASAESLICPFCQQNNQCGVNKALDCWCTARVIPQEMLELLPGSEQNTRCVCAQCVAQYHARPDAFIRQYISAQQ